MGSRLGAALRSRRSETTSGRPADLHGSRLGDTASRRALLSQRLCGSAVCRDLLRRTMWPSAAGNPSWKSRTSALAQASGPNERSFLKRLVGGKSTGSSCGASIAGGRSLLDLVITLQELTSLDVGFVSLSEALDLSTPSGRTLAGMLAVFAEFERDILRDRVKAGIAQARKEGRPHGRPPTVAKHAARVRALAGKGLSKSEISRRLRISRTSVRRFLSGLRRQQNA